MSARWPLRVGTVLVTLLCLCLSAWVGYDLLQSRARELKNAERAAETLARLLESHLQGTASKLDVQLSEFVVRRQFDIVDGIERKLLEVELADYRRRFPEIHSFRVADAQGRYVYDASGVISDVNIGDRSYFTHLRDNPAAGLVVSAPLRSRVTNDIVIVFARRIEDRRGNFAGIVLATLRADYFRDFYRQLDIGERGIIALWGGDMTLFARWPNMPAWEGRRLQDSPIPALLAAGQRVGVFRRDAVLDSERRIFAFRALDGFPLIVSVGLSEADILVEWKQRTRIYAVLGVALALALLALIRSWLRRYQGADALARSMAAAYEAKSREARALLDSIAHPAWLLDTDGRYLAVNMAFCRYIGRPMEEVVNHTVDELFPEEEANSLRAGQLDVYARGESVRQVVWLDVAGRRCPFEFLRSPVYGEDGQPCGLTGVAWDISERYEAEERQRLITHLFDHSNDAIAILDTQRHIVAMNRAATRISGYATEELKGRFPRFLFAEGQSPEILHSILYRLDQELDWSGELLIRHKAGQVIPLACHITAIRDEAGQLANWSLIVRDLSEHKAAEARIESLTHVDQLTELPNRQSFSRQLGDWLAAGRAGALIVLDLDQLGRVNDAFGHAAGDLLLTGIGQRMRHILRDGDVLGRLGGDQFGILLGHENTLLGIDVVARKLLEAVAQPIRIEGSDIVSTACAGICILGSDGEDVASVLRNVDAALHHAKLAGQGVFRFFANEMNEGTLARFRLENDLRWALSRQELRLYYQPQVDIATGRVVGFESLLRWQHPELGMVPPLDFISLAEESRLILPIGAWVLEEACRQNKAWQDAGLAPRVMAVNLSAVQFHGSDVVASVSHALAISGLAPQYLELEITESVIVEDPERVIRIMQELKALGVSLSIDDFGTGYSSLSYLKRFPIDKIKIDRSFVCDLEHDASDTAIVRMVIGIAAELEHRVIAEGVETAGQLNFLREHGCQEYQGYFFSRPLPAGQIPALLGD